MSKATEEEEEELIITKLNNLYKIIGYEKFCLFSDIFMSEIEEYKLNKQELNSNDLLRLLELSIEQFVILDSKHIYG